MRKKVKKFRKSSFLTDLHIICQNGSVSLHKIILFQKLPQVTSFLCNYCDPHSETTFILPEVDKEEIEREVKNLYAFGIASGVEELLGLQSDRNIIRIKHDNDVKVNSEIAAGSDDFIDIPIDDVSKETEDTLIMSDNNNFEYSVMNKKK